MANRERLVETIQKKPAHQRRKARVNKPSNQASAEARLKNRSRIANVRKQQKKK